MKDMAGMTTVPHHFGALLACGAPRKIFSLDLTRGTVGLPFSLAVITRLQVAFTEGPSEAGYVGIKAGPRAVFAGAVDGKVSCRCAVTALLNGGRSTCSTRARCGPRRRWMRMPEGSPTLTLTATCWSRAAPCPGAMATCAAAPQHRGSPGGLAPDTCVKLFDVRTLRALVPAQVCRCSCCRM